MGLCPARVSRVVAFSALLVLALSICSSRGLESVSPCAPYDGLVEVGNLPLNFQWGAATSAYQVEGATEEDGRGPCIWDVFPPERIADGTNADVACDSYHRYEEDLELVKSLGGDGLRVSISWSRILPDGTGRIEQRGVDHYRKVLSSMVRAGVEPVVALYHWDLPQALQERYGGWLDRQIISDFREYADICFREFGDLVQTWVTINEPNTQCRQGYNAGNDAPGRCSDRKLCPDGGDSWREPYIVCHNALLAHASAVDLYRREYQERQGGKIGIISVSEWGEPLHGWDSKEDVAAAERWTSFQAGWIFDPVVFGDYPAHMRERVGDRLPVFSEDERRLVMGSSDFLGFNFYGASFTYSAEAGEGEDDDRWKSDPWKIGWYADVGVKTSRIGPDGEPIGAQGASVWLHVVPWAMRSVLVWLAERYPGIPIYVTENGCSVPGEAEGGMLALDDSFRVDYLKGYTANLALAAADGVPVMGYYVWSLTDNFEFSFGITDRFGMFAVDFEAENLTRVPKSSAMWYSGLIHAAKECQALKEEAILREEAEQEPDRRWNSPLSLSPPLAAFLVTSMVAIFLMLVRHQRSHVRGQLSERASLLSTRESSANAAFL